MKPLWAAAGVALLGITGVAGAVLVASSGGEEEVVRQVATATPTRGAAKDPRTTSTETASAATVTPVSCDPNPSPARGHIVLRWGEITVQLPADGNIEAFGYLGTNSSGPTLRLSLYDATYIDATTGAIIHQTYVDPTTGASLPLEDVPEPEIEAVLATVSVCPFDRTTGPWPYSGEAPALPSRTLGKLMYIEPNPASGIQVLIGGECAHGCRDALAVHSARSEMQIDAETGEPWANNRVAEEDREAFERYRASIRIGKTQ